MGLPPGWHILIKQNAKKGTHEDANPDDKRLFPDDGDHRVGPYGIDDLTFSKHHCYGLVDELLINKTFVPSGQVIPEAGAPPTTRNFGEIQSLIRMG